jgi:hypothetical protein
MCTLVHVVVTQVGILQFSNDMRVELPLQVVDHQGYQKTLQTMVSSRGGLCCSLVCISWSLSLPLQHSMAP